MGLHKRIYGKLRNIMNIFGNLRNIMSIEIRQHIILQKNSFWKLRIIT